MMSAVLSNPSHPKYGVATIPFPIPRDQYAHCIVGYIPKRKRTHSHLSSHAVARYGAHCGDTLSFHGFGKNIHYLHYAGGQRQAKVLVRRPSFRRARDTGSIARQNR